MKIPAYRSVWLQLLLMASCGDYEVMFKGKRITLLPGQITVGSHQLGYETGVPRGTIVRILQCFESEHMIEQQKSNKCTLITILKWSKYQEREHQNEQQMNNKRTSDEHQMNTNQEGKKVKKERKKETEPILATPSAVAEKVPNPINEILEQFQMKVNPTINYGNSTQRGAVEYLLKFMGKEKLSRMIDFVESIKNEEFAPTITTPYQLKEKLAALTSYYQKKHNKPSNVISI